MLDVTLVKKETRGRMGMDEGREEGEEEKCRKVE